MEQNYIVEIIDSLAEKFGIVVDWTNQNVMPYMEDLMQRIVSYEISIYTFWMIFCPIAAVVFGIVSYNLIRKAKEKEDYYNEWNESLPGIIGIITAVFAFGFTVASLILIPYGTIRIIECVNIPEKIFIELIGAYI